jgi:hypothetical protein
MECVSVEWRIGKAPSSKFQAPEKLQIPSTSDPPLERRTCALIRGRFGSGALITLSRLGIAGRWRTLSLAHRMGEGRGEGKGR